MVLFEDTVPPPTPLVDGADPLTTGTPTDEDWYTDLDAALDKQLHSASDPTKYPSDIIAEIKDARGSVADLNTRLNGVVDATGTPVGLITPESVRNGFPYGNVVFNGGHVLWSRGDTSAPDGWTLDTATVTRCGSGQADTNVLDTGDTANFSALLAGVGSMSHNLVPTALQAKLDLAFTRHAPPVDSVGNVIAGYADPEDVYAYALVAVYSTGTSRARVGIGDLPTTASGEITYSEYHPGDSAWHWLLAGPMKVKSNNLDFSLSYFTDVVGGAYFMHAMVCFTTLELPPMFLPEKPVRKTHTFATIATPAAATGYGVFAPTLPVFILGIRAYAGTAPTGGTTLKLDLMTPIGGAGVFASLFNALPAFVASDVTLLKECDPVAANYRRRCIRGILAAAAAAPDNSVLRLDVNTRDSGNTGANIVVMVDYLEFSRPFEQWRTQIDLGE